VIEDFEGKGAVITGGASGIGRELAAHLVNRGARVMIADIEAAPLDAAGKQLGVATRRVDVSDAGEMRALATAAGEQLGRVHLVVNNAGVGNAMPYPGLTLLDWQWVVGVNLWGVINGIDAFLPTLDSNPDGGHIVNMGSIAGLFPIPAMAPYCASKYAVTALSETLALDLQAAGSKVGVTLVCPGAVRTQISRSHRNRPAALGTARIGAAQRALDAANEAGMIDPAHVASATLDAISNNRFWVLTHPELLNDVQARHDRIVASVEQV
jgi:NAD(P)-dependent dehydrogenase (short-subunit alcohol dehydrogenase family)